MNNKPIPTHIFVATPLEIRTVDGIPMPNIGPIFGFTAVPEDAEAIFFENGYILDSQKGLFSKSKNTNTSQNKLYKSEEFETTDDSNSTEDDIPDRLSMLFKGASPYKSGPYAGYPTENLRFGKLMVIRSLLPGPTTGGKRKTIRRRGNKKSTRKQRRSK